MSASSHQVHEGNVYMTEEEANQVIKKYDKNSDSILTKEELTAMVLEQASQLAAHKDVVCKPQKVPPKVAKEKGPSKIKFSRSQIREILEEHDIDGDGCLDVKEITKALSSIGSLMPYHKAHYGLNLADADGDGLIDEEELEKLLDYVEKVNKRKGGF